MRIFITGVENYQDIVDLDGIFAMDFDVTVVLKPAVIRLVSPGANAVFFLQELWMYGARKSGEGEYGAARLPGIEPEHCLDPVGWA